MVIKIQPHDYFLHWFPHETLLGNIGHNLNKYSVDPAKIQKQQRESDRFARQFLDDVLYISALKLKFSEGVFLKLLANAAVPIREAVILTGIQELSLKNIALNTFKQNPDSFSLVQLAELAGYETVAAVAFPWREPYQSCVKNYIQDVVKEEYRQPFLALCSHYFDMDSDNAKSYETFLHVVAQHFRMYPPEQEPPSTKSARAEVESVSATSETSPSAADEKFFYLPVIRKEELMRGVNIVSNCQHPPNKNVVKLKPLIWPN